jgi:hypothetical protein
VQFGELIPWVLVLRDQIGFLGVLECEFDIPLQKLRLLGEIKANWNFAFYQLVKGVNRCWAN